MFTLSRETAYAVATDAANRHMKLAGRVSWNDEDYNIATKTFNNLWPESKELCQDTKSEPEAKS